MIDFYRIERNSGRSGPCGRVFAGLLVILMACALWSTAVVAASSGDRADLSQANKLLFMSGHLDNLQVPAKLNYRFRRDGSKDDFSDRIDVVVDSDHDGDAGKHVHIDFLSGDRSRYIPDVDNAHGNPVIMMFLQQDVVAMAHQTGGSWRYFQKRIKTALAHSSKIDQTQADYNGEKVAARQIAIAPFADSANHRDAIGQSLGKRYVFTLSQDVPGGVLAIRAETPKASGKQAMTEELRLKSVEHQNANTSNEQSESS